ncbi:putative vacuolar ATP synthase subunit C [Cryptosporidium serpentis]
MAPLCSPTSTLFGLLGTTIATSFSNLGAAYGTAKAGLAIASCGVMRPDLVMRSIIPAIMAGILGVYGLIVGIIISARITQPYSSYQGFCHLAAGIIAGCSCVASGFAIGLAGEAGIRGIAQQSKLFVATILILIFAEALAIYGLIVALVLATSSGGENLCISY